MNEPFLFFPLMCVKPRKQTSQVHLPSPFLVLFGKSPELEHSNHVWSYDYVGSQSDSFGVKRMLIADQNRYPGLSSQR